MFFEALSFWILLLTFLIPLLFSGIVFVRKTQTIDRLELLLPVGSIIGLSFFVFFLNLISFFIKGIEGVIISYSFIVILGMYLFFKSDLPKISYPKDKEVYWYVVSLLSWGVFLIWKSSNALVGSDTDLYFSIAHTFIKGNFPPLTPWQPDLSLSYHIGSSLLIGSFYAFTQLSFNFLHIFFSFIFTFCIAQTIIWLWQQKVTISSFIFGNIASLVFLISFGFFKIALPTFPLNIPDISNLQQLFFWIRNLPTVNDSIEVYGAPVNLDGLLYFIHHGFGLALTLSLIAISFSPSAKKPILQWIMIFIGISSLALINESLFSVTAPAFILGTILIGTKENIFIKKVSLIFLMFLLTIISLFFQGGLISNTIFNSQNLEKSILVFPKKEQIKENFQDYHHYQQISKALPLKESWLPFTWFHIGIELELALLLILITFIKYSIEQKRLATALFVIGLSSLIAYNFIVPKFLIANGNRFLAFAFLFLSLGIIFSIQNLFTSTKKNKYLLRILMFLLLFFVVLPTIIPPLFLLSKNRFSENKLLPKQDQKSEAITWVEKNIPFDKRVMVLDIRTPHPSGQTRAMVQAGVFAPIFTGAVRAYTIEASPEYIDIAYYLSPNALKALKVDTLVIDSHFYESLISTRKQQILDNKYFESIFEKEYPDKTWEKVFKIKPEYLKSENELPGTFSELTNSVPLDGSIYIDSEKNFNPSFIRRPLIFSLRNYNLYFLAESGVYLNVEANINMHPPKQDNNYNFLILAKQTNPKDICDCEVKLLWKGLKDEVYIWQKISN